jgi:hypothetical protein
VTSFKAECGNSTCFDIKDCSVTHGIVFSSSIRARLSSSCSCHSPLRAVVTPHKTNYGIRSSSGNSTGFDPVEYPVGFQSTLNSTSDITYMDAAFDWRIPLRPFLGTIGKSFWGLRVSGVLDFTVLGSRITEFWKNRISRVSRVALQSVSFVLYLDQNIKTK